MQAMALADELLGVEPLLTLLNPPSLMTHSIRD
jgi:hypothetical protein